MLGYDAGAKSVDVSVGTGMVVVHGGDHLDPWTLKCFLRRFVETRDCRHHRRGARKDGVTIVNDGGRPDRSHHVGIVHTRPPEEIYYAPYPYPPLPPLGGYYGGPMLPPPPPPGGYYGGPPPAGRYYGGPRPPRGRYYGGPRWF